MFYAVKNESLVDNYQPKSRIKILVQHNNQNNHIDNRNSNIIVLTARKVSKYGVFSGPYFPVFGLNTGKYGPEKTPYFDTFHAVTMIRF